MGDFYRGGLVMTLARDAELDVTNHFRLPLDFEATVKALLGTPPPPSDTQGSRKAQKGPKWKAAKR